MVWWSVGQSVSEVDLERQTLSSTRGFGSVAARRSGLRGRSSSGRRPRWEVALGLDRLAYLPVQRFYGILTNETCRVELRPRAERAQLELSQARENVARRVRATELRKRGDERRRRGRVRKRCLRYPTGAGKSSVPMLRHGEAV